MIQLNDLHFSINKDVKQQMYIIHKVITNQLNQKRQGSANTKTRSEVKGGGKKPWKQKGTGRARAGSSRSPLWRGGGVIFGPKSKVYKSKTNKKERILANRILIYNKIHNIQIIDNLTTNLDQPKTKFILDKLNEYNIKINKNKKILIILENNDKNLYLSIRNIKNIELINVHNINVLSLIKAETIILTNNTLKIINQIYND
uniref:Large ribosomal subunit protein uL4c n=1 Tax=Taenioma perpusillum TaxID=210852 RepID=A0A1Z1MRT1_9FLOR|nr:ribosomal protein L4 [Taenioma perpusillum]ARW68542.1 ribosomal protein L4 [Taenioma perpusillum]